MSADDIELFDDSFHTWLDDHGVELTDAAPSPFMTLQAMIDVNTLKIAIINLCEAKQEQAVNEARIDELKSAGEWCSGDFGCEYYKIVDRLEELGGDK